MRGSDNVQIVCRQVRPTAIARALYRENCSSHCSTREYKSKAQPMRNVEVIERIGGDDGARTRDLRRDRFTVRARQIIDLPVFSAA